MRRDYKNMKENSDPELYKQCKNKEIRVSNNLVTGTKKVLEQTDFLLHLFNLLTVVKNGHYSFITFCAYYI